MATIISDNFKLTAPKNLDNSKGIYDSSIGMWRPYNSTSEIFSLGLALYESQIFPVKNGDNIEVWQLVGGTTASDLTFVTNAVYSNSVFNDLSSGTFINVPIQSSATTIKTITGLINNWTGELESYVQATVKKNGISLSEGDIVDGCGIYRKKGTLFYIKQFTGPIDARWFGLTNNATGCEVQLNRAIKATSEINAELYIPSGVYNLNAYIRLLNNTRLVGESNNGIAEPAFIITNGTVFRPSVAGANFAPIRGESISNIYLANLHFEGCYSFKLIAINNLTLFNIKSTNGTLHGIYAQAGTNINIDHCYSFNAKQFGIAVEGSSEGDSINVNITNCHVENSGDNGIAVRAIRHSVFNSNVSFNKIINSGKTGIKNTIEASSYPDVKFVGANIIGNQIDGWGSAAIESAIAPACYGLPVAGYPQQYIENVVVKGNAISSNNNPKQNTYIGVYRAKNLSVVGNVGTNGCNTTGLFIFRSLDCSIVGNVIEKACQAANTLAEDGGLVIQDSNNIVAASNIVKNSLNSRSGLQVFGSKNGIYIGNTIYDDQTTPTQLYGIEERSDSSYTAENNFYGANLTYGNIRPQNSITAQSRANQAPPILADDSDYLLKQATSLLILPNITANRILTLYNPNSNITVNTNIFLFNTYTGTYSQTLSTPAIDSYGNNVSVIESASIYHLKWYENRWLVINVESIASAVDVQTGVNTIKRINPLTLSVFWSYVKTNLQSINAVWINSTIAKYGSDLSATYDARTLVDKAYADNNYVRIIQDASVGTINVKAYLNANYPSVPSSTIIWSTTNNILYIKYSLNNWLAYPGTAI